VIDGNCVAFAEINVMSMAGSAVVTACTRVVVLLRPLIQRSPGRYLEVAVVAVRLAACLVGSVCALQRFAEVVG